MLEESFARNGFVIVPEALSAGECAALAATVLHTAAPSGKSLGVDLTSELILLRES